MAVIRLQSGTQCAGQAFARQITQVVSAVAIKIRNLCEAEFVGRVHQFSRFVEYSFCCLIQNDRLKFSEDHDIVETVAVEISGREKPRGWSGIGDPFVFLFSPLALRRLKANDELIWAAEIDDVRASIAVKIAQCNSRDFLINGQFPVFKSPMIAHHVDICRAHFLHVSLRRRGPLDQEIKPTVAVIHQQQVIEPVMVQVCRQ